MAWLRVGQASRVFLCLGVVIAVAAPGFLGHLPFNSDLGVNSHQPLHSQDLKVNSPYCLPNTSYFLVEFNLFP